MISHTAANFVEDEAFPLDQILIHNSHILIADGMERWIRRRLGKIHTNTLLLVIILTSINLPVPSSQLRLTYGFFRLLCYSFASFAATRPCGGRECRIVAPIDARQIMANKSPRRHLETRFGGQIFALFVYRRRSSISQRTTAKHRNDWRCVWLIVTMRSLCSSC